MGKSAVLMGESAVLVGKSHRRSLPDVIKHRFDQDNLYEQAEYPTDDL